ncbi:hypothetical protein ABEB36_006228 [Hypothenemus hampei]|uniref:Uncharacterized protein n=1 Tax=Hypothenemus hampei TaxID=57062 RepID=A0ABD1EPS9_HYPHA
METEDQNGVPDGGWGYIIVAATVVIFGTTIVPVSAFGLIYGDFLKSLGNETRGTTLSNGIIITVYSFTGILVSFLLMRFSYRKVCFLGSTIFLIGTVSMIFVQNFIQFIICFGFIEGLGAGLLMPASLSAFNSYFDKKMALMMCLSQAAMIAFNMVIPQLAAWSIETYGFRGTLIGLAMLGSLCFPASATLRPFPKKPIIRRETKKMTSTISLPHGEPLMGVPPAKTRKSVISLGDRIASVSTIAELSEEQPHTSTIFDLTLLKSYKYWNISIGLSLAFTGDLAFISIIPLLLGNLGFNSQEIGLMMGVFFASDLISRILLTIVSAFVRLKSRLLILFTSVLIVIGRTVLVTHDTYLWQLILLAYLGFLRCFIQSLLPLVFSEEYQDNFATAYSLFMAINGVVSVICGPLMSLIKDMTGSDVMMSHVLTLAYIICVITWMLELTFFRKKHGKKNENK